jgi:hypothetical protein
MRGAFVFLAGHLVVSGGMSRHNNVNPGQYKVAGREKPGKLQGLNRTTNSGFPNR